MDNTNTTTPSMRESITSSNLNDATSLTVNFTDSITSINNCVTYQNIDLSYTTGNNLDDITSSICNFTNFTKSINNSLTSKNTDLPYIICFSLTSLIIICIFFLYVYKIHIKGNTTNYQIHYQEESKYSSNGGSESSSPRSIYNISYYDYSNIRKELFTESINKNDNSELLEHQENNIPASPNEATPLSSLSNSTIHTIKKNTSKNFIL
ncbi:hypothetical protein K6025_05145 [Ehrlichia sp. JZT12]